MGQLLHKIYYTIRCKIKQAPSGRRPGSTDGSMTSTCGSGTPGFGSKRRESTGDNRPAEPVRFEWACGRTTAAMQVLSNRVRVQIGTRPSGSNLARRPNGEEVCPCIRRTTDGWKPTLHACRACQTRRTARDELAHRQGRQAGRTQVQCEATWRARSRRAARSHSAPRHHHVVARIDLRSHRRCRRAPASVRFRHALLQTARAEQKDLS